MVDDEGQAVSDELQDVKEEFVPIQKHEFTTEFVEGPSRGDDWKLLFLIPLEGRQQERSTCYEEQGGRLVSDTKE